MPHSDSNPQISFSAGFVFIFMGVGFLLVSMGPGFPGFSKLNLRNLGIAAILFGSIMALYAQFFGP